MQMMMMQFDEVHYFLFDDAKVGKTFNVEKKTFSSIHSQSILV
jgi:hypothetical protein